MRACLVYGVVLAVLMLCAFSSSFSTMGLFQVVSAEPPNTLAQTLNSVIDNVNWTYGNSWTANWAIILANQGNSAFDNAITQDISRGDYIDALYVARLAELNDYTSNTISQGTFDALQQISMCGSLPITANAHSYGDPDISNSGCFLLYDRFALWAYQYASTYNLTGKWNVTQAFMDFTKAYDANPRGSVSGEMLWCDPQENWAASYSSRYYDEHAETLSAFLQFAKQEVPNAMGYADLAWEGVQAHWNGQYYGYTGTSVVECEMGNFAQIIAEYKEQKGGMIPYWDRVISDLNYKLLSNGWSSPGWSTPGVLKHATTNDQLRLWETMGAVIALQELFGDFNSTMKTGWTNMLMGENPAWQGLVDSSLNQNGYFCGVGGVAPSNDATACAAATLFLEGVVPVTGSLAIPSREEFYSDLRTPFEVSSFQFNYVDRVVRIPVHAGEVEFIYGVTPVSYTFPADGVYKIQFSNDWNSIRAVDDQPLVVSVTPTGVSVPYGESVTLTALVSGGSGPYTYQWYLNGEAVLGATGSSWTFTPKASGEQNVYLKAVDALGVEGQSGVVTNITTYEVYLLLNSNCFGSCVKGQTVAVDTTVFNGGCLDLVSALALTVTGPDGYCFYDFQTINISANGVDEYSFNWVVPSVKGTFVVEVGLVPGQLTAYDSVWLDVV